MSIYLSRDAKGNVIGVDDNGQVVSDAGLNAVADAYAQRKEQEAQASQATSQQANAGNWSYEKAQNLYNSYMANSQVTDPDKAARLNEAAGILGIDDNVRAGMVGQTSDAILKAAEVQAKRKQGSPDDWQAFASENPATATYLEQQKNMAMSWDDVSALGKIEKAWTSVKDHAQLSDLEQRKSELGMELLKAGGTLADLDPAKRAELEDIDGQIKSISSRYGNDPNYHWYNPLSWSLGDIAGGIATMKNDAEEGLRVGTGTALYGAAAGSLAGGVGAAPGALTGLGAGFSAM